ncbi:hypothetical protein QAD02_007615 [Eretmocerus hayati]|uniref:Uncharacterized protein n=1 Tax=Eretmocerus hayati TaxID=131215 RepID=A0ACC2N4T8_9HYME|nr:hypothetical protein QAD02_007615 [Eretmocerus hayati]
MSSYTWGKRGEVLPDATVESVKNFYNRDDVSRLMPGMSDYVSVKTKDGKREQVRKKLLLCNLNDLDGASQHFKNKSNFANIVKHEEDFGILAECHYRATAHGEGACDGIGANLKRGAKRASLQRTSQNHILTAQALYEWAKVYCKEADIFFSPTEYYERVKQGLQSRFEDAEVVPGTLQYHAFISTPDRKLQCKKFSPSVKSDLSPKGKRSRIAQPKVPTGKPLRKSSAKPITETQRKTAKGSVAETAPKNRKKPRNELKTSKRLQGQNIKKKE